MSWYWMKYDLKLRLVARVPTTRLPGTKIAVQFSDVVLNRGRLAMEVGTWLL